MLDATELAKRLTAAMDYRDPPLKSVELAKMCDVTKQAVHEWRTTGRIGKQHLMTVAQATGTPIEFWLETERGSMKSTRIIWMKFGKAFAKAAAIALLSLSFLQAPDAQAKIFDKSPACVLCQILNLLISVGISLRRLFSLGLVRLRTSG